MESKVRKFNPIIASAMKLNQAGGRRSLSYLGGSLLAGALLTAGSAAQAQTTSPTGLPAPVPSTDETLSWHGITLYGVVDVDMQYETHGAPFSNYFISGGSDIVQKNSNNPVFGVTSNGMSQSRIGLQGKEPLHFMDWSGVFKLETYFNPASGQITDALKSVVQNNGRSLANQSTNIDSSIAGQPFEQAFVGFSSPTYGTFTFGRQNSTLADLIAKYDPQQTSYAFSLLGLSGTPAGGGDTQDRRLDSSIKYDANFFDIVHVGAQYKTQGSTAQNYAAAGTGEAFSGFEVAVGAQYAGASADVFYTKMRDAVSVSALSATQVAALPALNLSVSNSVAATISDNASYGVMASYAVVPVPVTVYGGYQHITYMNPSIPLAPGFDDIGGYVLGAVSNTTYAKADKILQVYWAGARYRVTDQLTAAIAYYGEEQNSFATGADAGCTSTVSGSCRGNFHAVSVSVDYHFTKRFDSYAGAMWSNVSNGLANGYLETSMIDPTIGVRFSF
ncbi:MAG TPA: porin [Steroidobacteraceae bacterium]|nr:porin [Steroidobacteraceae bacterium]